MTSDHFNFHIKKLVEREFVEKDEDTYSLTRSGKEYANRMDTDENVIEVQPKISVALIIENDKGEILAQERRKQPYFGFWGRPTGKIRRGEEMLEAAARELMEETGLTADLRVAGVYHKMDYERDSLELLDDKVFVLIYGTNPVGELVAEQEGHRNEWLSDEELLAKEHVFESIVEITKMARADAFQFMEHKYYYGSSDF